MGMKGRGAVEACGIVTGCGADWGEADRGGGDGPAAAEFT
jgi:hypothetical protein